jgi:glyoxylase-like metal-dependent hydrolase (beta-lactamase superfamily II)
MNSDASNIQIDPTGDLIYPLASEPETGDGSAVEIAPGVLWLRMPLSYALPWINVWALQDGASWTLVDTGLRSAKSTAAWQAAFAGVLGGAAVARVLCTHMHPDHCGMAGWIVEKYQARLWMSRLEYLTCRLMAADTGRSAPPAGIQFYRAAGWDNGAIEDYKAKFGKFGEAIYPLPATYRRLVDGELLTIGANRWRVVMGNGHSPEHACLYCPALNLLISGDQVLPKISSNVSVFPTEPDADPLEDWLTSLARIKQEVPDDVLVLPAHGSPFLRLHRRLDQLIDGHRRGLDRLLQSLAEPKRTVDVFESLFRRQISPELLGMATGESLAHLNHLLRRQQVNRVSDGDEVQWWRAV